MRLSIIARDVKCPHNSVYLKTLYFTDTDDNNDPGTHAYED